MAPSRNIIDLPYDQRRLLVVAPGSPVSKIQKFSSEHPVAAGATGGAIGLGVTAAAAAVAPVALTIVGATVLAGVDGLIS